jgi:uncharacterized membrane protein (DUF106 family)
MTYTGLPPGIEELLIAAVISLLVTLIYKFLINQEELREIKQKQREHQAKAKDIQHSNPDEAKKLMNEMLNLSNKQMKMTMKPMIVTLFVSLFLIFPFLPKLYEGAVVFLPFSLPYFGNDFGWLMWYFVVSIPLNAIIRKILDVEI